MGGDDLLPVFVDSLRQCRNFLAAEEQQVLGFATFRCLELDVGQRDFGFRQRLRSVALACQGIDDGLVNALGAHRQFIRVEHAFAHFFIEKLPYRSLVALARYPRPACTTEESILGRAGVVAVQVGRREVLQDVNFDQGFHSAVSVAVSG